jgi:FKBP12-rapamycin complex-associated protein
MSFVQVNAGRLLAAGEASQRSTKEDWAEWMRHFSIELLKESPSPALRTCARLAQLQVLVVVFICTIFPLGFGFGF